ncbi:hypothetical protein [Pseudodesulfovibrio sediminis]|uniref:Uncharacterized protein n=1 Tax=Pseudodesulfovibrio sediminis TaxID=2810563 RepID=A0ABN6EPX6_9BACT|nr:hypothetical protein [Pseudodesulfovibrio sediminis]BCS87348.1 hypothetical protein PSDVSF_05900 [Pseudodesulfovibrio sediminis]
MTEAEQIKRKWDEFRRVWRLMWLAFGKDEPKQEFKEDVWEQCQYIPFEAWGYILVQVRGMDAPPRNWAKKLKALHFQWRESNGGQQQPEIRRERGDIGYFETLMKEARERNPHMNPLDLVRMIRPVYEGREQCTPRTH